MVCIWYFGISKYFKIHEITTRKTRAFICRILMIDTRRLLISKHFHLKFWYLSGKHLTFCFKPDMQKYLICSFAFKYMINLETRKTGKWLRCILIYSIKPNQNRHINLPIYIGSFSRTAKYQLQRSLFSLISER